MAVLTADMRRVIDEQKLGFVATVGADGAPNLSPKGTLAVVDDEHLAFIDIRSPATVRNLAANPAMEINVVDQTLRKGYRFKGVVEVLSEGPRFDELTAFYRARGSTSSIRHIVVMTVQRAAPLTSPAYDQGRSEADVTAQWDAYWDDVRRKREGL